MYMGPLLPAVRKIVAGLDAEIPVQGAQTMEENVCRIPTSGSARSCWACSRCWRWVWPRSGSMEYFRMRWPRAHGSSDTAGYLARGADILWLVLREAAILSGADSRWVFPRPWQPHAF
jgi:hypothetical protein